MSAVDTAAPITTGTVWDELVSELPVGVLLQDEHGAVLAANSLAGHLLGLSRAQLLRNTRPDGWQVCDDSGAPLPQGAELAAQVLRGNGRLAVPLVVVRNGIAGSRLWADFHAVNHRGRPSVLTVLQPVHTDVPHSRGLIDPLTGLPSRALLLDRLEQSLTRSRTNGSLSTFVLVDVRKLAEVNAEHGFDVGDGLLTVLAGRLRQGLRDDHTVARYGGDEFAVVAEHPCGTGEPIAARVRELTQRAVLVGKVRLHPKVRVCWATSDGSAPAHTVIGHVEKRLRTA
ncbi:GGDEF domain-containing protein [Kutzneria chonburiensis]|uniref:Diguanylate cyclase domain-containing protein n=1 Tax=Kutzneria chonburiensis TaxID=1483604 RepID=A0ABV6N191_9PSEU|nr:sensor domain-containing diguanylate cyclase [Kutzneria chonburiensis]